MAGRKPENVNMKTDSQKSETVSGSAFPPDTGDDSLCNVRRLRAEIRMLRAALQPLADLLDGDLENVGGGTLIAPTIKVQMVKDAKCALTADVLGGLWLMESYCR